MKEASRVYRSPAVSSPGVKPAGPHNRIAMHGRVSLHYIFNVTTISIAIRAADTRCSVAFQRIQVK